MRTDGFAGDTDPGSIPDPGTPARETVPDTRAAQPRFDRPRVLVVSYAHFAHDCYPAFLGVMLPLLIDELGISLAMAGILASGLRWTTTLQPFLGYLADRSDTRYWVVLTPTTTAVCMSLLGVAPNPFTVMVLLLLAGLSHAAFHPAGGALATRASGTEWGRGGSYFMTGGELGRVVGPLFIAGVLAAGGLGMSPVAVIPGVAASLVLYRMLLGTDTLPVHSSRPTRVRDALRTGRRQIALLSAAVFLRSFANVGIVIFYPTYATQLGHPLLMAGVALAVYETGAVGGTFLGGILSDRRGRVPVMLVGLVLAAVPLIGAVLTGPTPLGLVLLAVGGFALLSANAVQLVLMQQLLPENRSSAVGMAYFVKAGGAIFATISIGAAGDVIGLRNALIGAVLVGMLAAPFLALIREPERTAPVA